MDKWTEAERKLVAMGLVSPEVNSTLASKHTLGTFLGLGWVLSVATKRWCGGKLARLSHIMN